MILVHTNVINIIKYNKNNKHYRGEKMDLIFNKQELHCKKHYVSIAYDVL